MKKKSTAKRKPTIAALKRRLQVKVNAYVRHRDSKDGYFTCISCGEKHPVSKMNAGHYIPVGRSQKLRFHEENIHGECQRCNLFDEFHLIPYRKNLIDKIGIDMVEWLEKHSKELKQWKRDELEELDIYYTSLLSEA